MAARLEYNWSTEYKNDKRLLEMRDACKTILLMLNKEDAELPEPSIRGYPTSAKKARVAAPPAKPKPALAAPKVAVKVDRRPRKAPSVPDDGSSTADSDYIARGTFTNPMDDMSEYESDDSLPPPRPAPKIYEKVEVEDDDGGDDDSDDENADKACKICDINENDSQSLLCDLCEDVFHTYCVGLPDVPKNDWFCSTCLAAEYIRLTHQFMAEPLAVLNTWLVHASGCDARDDVCQSASLARICVFLKRLVRAIALTDGVLRAKFGELLTHHIGGCTEKLYCPVPLCNQMRKRKAKVHIRALEL
ncbi:hypothetical protein SPRG_02255 [Saprolegnia parasitica CBS 223.65]|uniref:PHD-type domain-containing protein n=1 Tax=Saprolegnia parasitica (strain CBS 223.65) TaxID=695850 RepID=A0A067CSE6_SAPPC|nr:hypothetical protein SPRG_02255 [Saprolegnia parasitica CBS 223.65]KDO33448.1 hypothetical protein SPRG_02255 [Saprolegnia parasitica CBS 223.65]|eukprot:XP_012196194.1 hypothetical protein SPRG_02255 [Saprolegnia parasitica CBS 223.65]